ncbi:hypothetical protein EST38_g10846 [Candolleomyces aberdarensis]|uniref:Uncharacterized protein n=1 Tax=Candolleomyces aberdarensis TaxID=2316362 RepID=A0A4Q2D968_9AGAR|nr:hypothetical protein EST38_g10846 [Candolleomyces aberdarensis]
MPGHAQGHVPSPGPGIHSGRDPKDPHNNNPEDHNEVRRGQSGLSQQNGQHGDKDKSNIVNQVANDQTSRDVSGNYDLVGQLMGEVGQSGERERTKTTPPEGAPDTGFITHGNGGAGRIPRVDVNPKGNGETRTLESRNTNELRPNQDKPVLEEKGPTKAGTVEQPPKPDQEANSSDLKLRDNENVAVGRIPSVVNNKSDRKLTPSDPPVVVNNGAPSSTNTSDRTPTKSTPSVNAPQLNDL